MAANALPGVLHAIAQRRPRAHFRAGDDTAELAILPPPRDRDRSRVAALYVGKLSLLGGLSLKALLITNNTSVVSLYSLTLEHLFSLQFMVVDGKLKSSQKQGHTQ